MGVFVPAHRYGQAIKIIQDVCLFLLVDTLYPPDVLEGHAAEVLAEGVSL